MMLLEDDKLAIRMGQEARKTAIEQFSITNFSQAFLQSIETARSKWQARNATVGLNQDIKKFV
jgi:hypothetical protein